MNRCKSGPMMGIACVVVALTVSSCAQVQQGAMAPPATTPARDFLVGPANERGGYGLYSYVLFADPPTAATRQRYLAALTAVLDLPTAGDMADYVSMRQINVTLVPVRRPLADTASAESVLASYNYARARALLMATMGAGNSGPYIVSSPRPINPGQAPAAGYLWQDLSAVPPALVRLWVSEFLAEAVNEEGYENQPARVSWTNRLRTVIAVAADGVPEVRNALETLIKWYNDDAG